MHIREQKYVTIYLWSKIEEIIWNVKRAYKKLFVPFVYILSYLYVEMFVKNFFGAVEAIKHSHRSVKLCCVTKISQSLYIYALRIDRYAARINFLHRFYQYSTTIMIFSCFSLYYKSTWCYKCILTQIFVSQKPLKFILETDWLQDVGEDSIGYNLTKVFRSCIVHSSSYPILSLPTLMMASLYIMTLVLCVKVHGTQW